ncbi:MAG: nucleotidyl transferase AbiEii/AbiGii toxin family protein [Candidatus Micrarchaeota archaeon]
MQIPLRNRLRKRLHTETAMLQDEVADMVYSIEPKAVLHGGTAIWRCYGGNRFSEDLDFYFPPEKDFEKNLREKASERGLSIPKYKMTENVIFAKISGGETEVRLEINLSARKKGIPKPYERLDGSFMDVFTLSPEELILEKISAYSGRRLIRDIYDIYHLSRLITDDSLVKKEMQKFLKEIPAPLDEKTLAALLYSGAVPSFAQMGEALNARFSK